MRGHVQPLAWRTWSSRRFCLCRSLLLCVGAVVPVFVSLRASVAPPPWYGAYGCVVVLCCVAALWGCLRLSSRGLLFSRSLGPSSGALCCNTRAWAQHDTSIKP
jgi:hypothetical protein